MSQKPRPRRIAADEAHSWARNLRLGNPFAKLLLCMLSIYVNSAGECYASVNALADDTELDRKTVMSRLDWLEKAGFIRRKPQWMDSSGARNSDVRGRRTSDLIVLLMDGREENSTYSDDNPSGPSEGPQRSVPRTTKAGLRSVSGPPVVHLDGLAESSEPEPEQEGGGGAREPLVSDAAFDLAADVLSALGIDPEFIPPGWCGLPLWLEGGLKSGWRPEIVLLAAQKVRAQQNYEQPQTFQYLTKPIAREHRLATTTRVQIAANHQENADAKAPAATDWRSSRDAFRLAFAKLGNFVDQRNAGRGGGDGAQAVPAVAAARPARR